MLRLLLAVTALAAVLVTAACTGAPQRQAPEPGAPERGTAKRPLALIYRGVGATNRKGCPDCSEVWAKMLAEIRPDLDIRYVGPHEALPLDAATLRTAVLYVQPGGDEDVDKAYKALRKAKPAIRDFVRNGGYFVGSCMGGFLAPTVWEMNDNARDKTRDPGFKLIPGEARRYITSPGASVTDEEGGPVEVVWRGKERQLYFQDAPYFTLDGDVPGTTILARYASNNAIAALVVPYGKGRVGVVGPHPEADSSWRGDIPSAYDLGKDLVDTTMAGSPANSL